MRTVDKQNRLLILSGRGTAPEKGGNATVRTMANPLTENQEPSCLGEDPNFLKMRYELQIAALKRGMTINELMTHLKERYNAYSLKQITIAQYKEFHIIVRALPKVIE